MAVIVTQLVMRYTHFALPAFKMTLFAAGWNCNTNSTQQNRQCFMTFIQPTFKGVYINNEITCGKKVQFPLSLRHPHSGTGSSIFDSPISSSITSSSSDSPLCSSITPCLFHSRLKTYFFFQPLRTITQAVSSELLDFLFLVFPYFFVSVPCARLTWPSRQLLSAHKSTTSYRIVWYRIITVPL